MKYRFLIIIIPLSIVILSFVTIGKKHRYQVYDVWNNIELSKNDVMPDVDSTFILVSNRQFNPSDSAFFTKEVDSKGELHIVMAQKINDKWYIHYFDNLSDAIDLLPKRNFVFYTEGMGKTFPINLGRGLVLAVQHDVNVIMFDYPSIDPDRSWFTNFSFAYEQAKNAADTYRNYLNLIADAQNEIPEKFDNVSTVLFNHSMGNRMVKHMLLDSSASRITLNVDRMVLNAACVPSKNHNEWVEKIDFANEVIINYNEDDFQLNGASVLTLSRMLGVNPDDELAKNAQYVDMNPSLGRLHSSFINIPDREPIDSKVFDYYNHLFNAKQFNNQFIPN